MSATIVFALITITQLHVHAQYTGEALKIGLATGADYTKIDETKKSIKDAKDAKIAELERKLIEERDGFKRVWEANERLRKQNEKIQAELDSLLRQINIKDSDYRKLMDRYLNLREEYSKLYEKNVALEAEKNYLKDKIIELNRTIEDLNLRLAKVPPVWRECNITPIKDIKKGYEISMFINTSEIKGYKPAKSRLNIRLVKIYDSNRGIIPISAIGDGLFTNKVISIAENATVELYFKTDKPLERYGTVYPILEIYIDDDNGNEEQLSLIDNIKCVLK